MRNNKVKILFDAGPMVNGDLTGVGKATYGLITSLATKYPNEIELVGHYFDFFYSKKNVVLPKNLNIRYRRTVFIPGKVFNMLRRLNVWIPFEILVKERGDFHLFPGFVGWQSIFKTPSAPFIHDITFIDFPQYVSKLNLSDLRKLVPKTIKKASFIITNSQSSKNGICKNYELAGKPVLVEHIPLVGVTEITNEKANKIIDGFQIKQPFILFLGTIEPRKNLIGLLNAYGQLVRQKTIEYQLVLAGGRGWLDEEINRVIENINRSSDLPIIKTGYVSDKERAALYSKATIFVSPSHYEGFGMQLLEAMYYKTPLLVSNISAHKEVARDAALYCSTDSRNIAEKLNQLTNDKKLRKKLINNGQIRLQDFSWDKVSTDVFEQIQKTLDK